MTWPDRISVFHKFRSRPTESTDSLILDVMILSETRQRPAARCLEDLVVYDYNRGQKTSLAPFMLEQFAKQYDEQEASRLKNIERIKSLFIRVHDLEKQTWDRPNAKEDFGGQGN